MSDVKRYSFWPQIVHLPGGGGVRAEVHFKVEEDGLFVAHQDYASLKAENEELHKDYEALADEHTKLIDRNKTLKAKVEELKDDNAVYYTKMCHYLDELRELKAKEGKPSV